MMKNDPYREGDAAYQAAGGYEGLWKLSEDFYRLMDSLPEYKDIRALHHLDMAVAAERLALFLSGYFNGPKLYEEKHGPFRLAAFHQRLPIGSAERDAWLACMKLAIDRQPWDSAFKTHAFQRLRTPADRCRSRS